MKKYLVSFFVLVGCLTFSLPAEAATKPFHKQATEAVPLDRSLQQQIDILAQRLRREILEEAGSFVKSELRIEDGNISKEEISIQTGAVSNMSVHSTSQVKDGQLYVSVEVNISVDTDSVKNFLTRMQKDTALQMEIEQWRSKYLELEKQLQSATKQQYEAGLADEVAQQLALQKKYAIEYQKLAVQAKEDLAKVQEEQERKNAARDKEMALLKQKIAQEKAALKKAELDNQLQIKEMETRAQKNLATFRGIMYDMSIQEALRQAEAVRQEAASLINEFKQLQATQQKTTEQSYREQIALSTNTSPQDNWESTQSYQERLAKNQETITRLTAEKQAVLEKGADNLLQGEIETLRPLAEKLQHFQTARFHDAQKSRAELVSLGKVNADKHFFELVLKYDKKKYKVKYDFPDIELEKAKQIYATANQFIIEPSFSVNANKASEATPFLRAFVLTHLSMDVQKVLFTDEKATPFKEVTHFQTAYIDWNNVVDMALIKDNIILQYRDGTIVCPEQGITPDLCQLLLAESQKVNAQQDPSIIKIPFHGSFNHQIKLKEDGTLQVTCKHISGYDRPLLNCESLEKELGKWKHVRKIVGDISENRFGHPMGRVFVLFQDGTMKTLLFLRWSNYYDAAHWGDRYRLDYETKILKVPGITPLNISSQFVINSI